MSDSEYMTYMGHQWLLPEGDILTVGVNEDGLEEFSEISKVHLPSEGDRVKAEEIFAELETDEGPMNIYSPVAGKIAEVNSMVLESPELIMEDPTGEGWLVRIEMDNADDIHGVSDDDDDEDDDPDNFDDDEDSDIDGDDDEEKPRHRN